MNLCILVGFTVVHTALILDTERAQYSYHPLPAVLAKGLGAKVWDVNGKEYVSCQGFGSPTGLLHPFDLIPRS